jgi:hypothetical protein
MGEIEEVGAAATVAVEQALSQSSSPSASSPCGQYMLHRVGKIDTHAGVAIKYGVEVKRREYCWLGVSGFNIALEYQGGYKIEAFYSL